MKNALKVSLAAAVLVVSAGSITFGSPVLVTDFSGVWTNGDTRDATGTNVGPTGRVDLDVVPPAPSPSGYNAMRLTTDTGSSKATLVEAGVNFGSIANFSGSYNWYKEDAGAPAPAFKLCIDTSDANPGSSRPNEASFDKFLIYEPYDNPDSNDPGTNVWVTQTFGLNTGTWWMVDRTAGNLVVDPPYSSITLQQWLNDPTYGALLTGGTIVALQIGQGSGNPDLTSFVDEVSYTYGEIPTTEDYAFGSPVPEPATLGALGVSALGLLARRRRS